VKPLASHHSAAFSPTYYEEVLEQPLVQSGPWQSSGAEAGAGAPWQLV